jgi:mannose-1-phosphate guanylyltransferase
LFDSRFAATIAAMRGFGSAPLDALYQNLRTMDFSKDVLQGRESLLKVITVPHCGWTDLGTPERVGRILESLQDSATPPYFPAHVSLADQFMRSVSNF